MSLQNNFSGKIPEAGCDEAGRGCLAGPVFAAAVILPSDFYHPDLNDSKKLSEKQRNILKKVIEEEALSFSVAKLDASEIDKYNILWASVRAMHKALHFLSVQPEHIIIDGNKFIPFGTIAHDCIVGGDARFCSIAAASILAKTYRDEYMVALHEEYPQFQWKTNKGYPTRTHREAILVHGPTQYHRKSFQLYPADMQMKLF